MSTTFHILDAISQDVDGETLINNGYVSDDDPEVMRIKKKKAAEDSYKNPGKLAMNIFLFGKTAEGVPVRACVEGFEPFFYVRLPDDDVATHELFKKALNDHLRRVKPWLRTLYRSKRVERKVLYGYTGGKSYSFAELTVPSLMAFRALRRIFLDPEVSKPLFRLAEDADPLEVYEANLDPMLRFFHLRNIKPCGWVKADAELEEGQLNVSWEEIAPTTGPIASAPFLMAAWDIECYSENGEFTLAKKSYDRLAKQLYALANTPQEAAMLIINAATGSPDEGMDHLRHKTTLDENALRESMESDVFLDGLEPLLIKKEGLSPASKEDRIRSISSILAGTIKRSLPLAGDPIIQIGTVFIQNGAEPERHIFVFHPSGECDNIPGLPKECRHRFRTEKGLIIGWAKALVAKNPDILMGYNVFGYDERYVWERAEELGITADPSIQALSRMVDKDKGVELEKKFLSSSAMGDNTLHMLTLHGRLKIDLFHYVKRNFSLPAYKLDYVCQHFMSGKCGGVDTANEDTWIIKTKTTGDVVAGRYIVLLDETGDTVVDKLRIMAVEPGKHLAVEAPKGDDTADLRAASADAVKWAIVKDDVSPQDIFRLHRDGGGVGRSRVAAYCIQDCDLTVELYKKLDVFNNAMAMANACSVPVSYIFTRGQGIKIESLIFKECYARGQCVVVLPTHPRKPDIRGAVDVEEGAAEQQDSYEGAYVLTPKPGFYFKTPIGVADFASLYPSTIISENISHDMLVWVKRTDFDRTGKPVIGKDGKPVFYYEYGSEEAEKARLSQEGVAWTDIEFDVWGTKDGDMRKNPEKDKKGLRICRYAQLPGKGKGTLPEIVQGLLAARKAKRKEAEKETDPFKKALLDAEQLAYKLTANSLYGQLGSSTFKIRLQHLAASVTAYGRKQIMFAKAAIEMLYGPEAGRPDCAAETVYGDTDSLFIDFKVRNPETGEPLEGEAAISATKNLTEEAGKAVTAYLKAPHDFEYDKTFSPFIIFSKKRYVGNKYEDSVTDYYQTSMGIATKRRDYAGIVKVIYGGAIRILLTNRDPIAAAEFVKGKLLELAHGRVSMNQLTMTKSLRAEYKAATPPAHKMLAERIALREPGNAPASGDRISFLYVMPPVGQQASKLQGERIETPGFIREKGLAIDVKFYMEHQLMNPLSQLFDPIVEQLPGCVAPGGRSWAKADASDREYAATEYLFRDALNLCDKNAERRFATLFGPTTTAAATAAATTQQTARRPTGTAAAAQKKPTVEPRKYVQTRLQVPSISAQSAMLKELEKTLPRRSPRIASSTSPKDK
jgi:DNA polymerase elongation subunit (family B)